MHYSQDSFPGMSPLDNVIDGAIRQSFDAIESQHTLGANESIVRTIMDGMEDDYRREVLKPRQASFHQLDDLLLAMPANHIYTSRGAIRAKWDFERLELRHGVHVRLTSSVELGVVTHFNGDFKELHTAACSLSFRGLVLGKSGPDEMMGIEAVGRGKKKMIPYMPLRNAIQDALIAHKEKVEVVMAFEVVGQDDEETVASAVVRKYETTMSRFNSRSAKSILEEFRREHPETEADLAHLTRFVESVDKEYDDNRQATTDEFKTLDLIADFVHRSTQIVKLPNIDK